MLSPDKSVQIAKSISFDVFGYYLYLPAIVIHQDPGLEKGDWLQELFEKYRPSDHLYQVWGGHKGRGYTKYSIGLSFIYLPFFLIAHIIALSGDYPADGLSYPYQLMMGIGSYIIVFIGLVFAAKVLRRFFSDGISAVTILLLFLGTNYLQLASFQTHTAHPIMFTLYSIVAWLAIRWNENNFDFKTGKKLFAVYALAMLARPNSILLGFFILLYNVNSIDVLKAKVQLFWARKKEIRTYALIVFLVALPQMLYWLYTTGKPIIYSYPNDGFDFLSPFFKESLFSYRKGWLLYTPIMVLSIVGVFVVYKNYPALKWAIPAFSLLNIYMLCSWNAWWFGGSYGNRGYVESYAIMLIPLAAFIQWAIKSNGFIKLLSTLLIVGFCALNIFQTWQMNHWILDANYMTKNYYWAVFGKTSTTPEVKKQRALDRSATFSNKNEYNFLFEKDLTPLYSKEKTKDLNFEELTEIRFDTAVYKITKEEHLWVIADVELETPEQLQEWDAALVLSVKHRNKFIKDKKYWFRESNDGVYLHHIEFLTPMLKSAKKDYLRANIRFKRDFNFKVKSFKLKFYEPMYFWGYEKRKEG